MARFKPPGQCPVCGEWVPRGAVACDECGSCAKSGWNVDALESDGLDLPDEGEFDYDDFVRREFGAGGAPRDMSPGRFWRVIALLVLGVLVIGWLMSAR